MQEIIHIIEALKPGDRVVVFWRDACRVTNDPDVRPEYYVTPKETQGTVSRCVPDPNYPYLFHLIIDGETTGGRADYYDSIPIGWIVKIERLEPIAIKRPQKEAKLATDQYTVKRVMTFKGGRQVGDSGGIAKLPKKWARSLSPCKFNEEIIKVVT